jgi:DNA-binding response OmpR family regulator
MSRILVVEESPDLRLLYKQELEREGDRVITATNSVQAIQEFEVEAPDLVVLDAGPSSQGGLRVVEQMLALDRKVPIVLNTACTTCADEPLGWAVDAYLIKSSDTSELRSKVQALLHPLSTHQEVCDGR